MSRARHHSKNRQAGTYRLAVMPGAGHVSADEGISSKFGKFPVNIRVVVAREAYKETRLQGPSAVIALLAACLVNTGPYRGTTLSLRLAAIAPASRGTLKSPLVR